MPDGALAPATNEAVRADRARLLAFAQDAETEAVFRDAFAALGAEQVSVRRGALAAAKQALQRMPTPANLVIDVSGSANPITDLDDLAQFVEPGARVLVVGDSTDLAFYRRLTRGLGVLEYLAKPLNRDLVARHFLPLVAGRDGADGVVRGGRVVSVLGVRGGVGASTIAANLALLLAEEKRHHTLLLDPDLHAGTAALLLGGEAGGGFRQALEAPDRVDELLVERLAQPLKERLHLVAAEESLDSLPRVEEGAARRLIKVVRRRYNVVLIDLPRAPSALNRELLDESNQRVIVMDPSLAAVRDALRHLAQGNAPGQFGPPLLVLNQAGAPGMLSGKQVRAALGRPPDIEIPYLPRQVRTAATLGQPAILQRGAFRREIARLARETVPAIAEARAPAKRWWRR
ncbi:MAG: AAA family ATPase [Acetobacteraceae bacterium]|nr:AAA family ATPase [Acetobacteraceae bacterium]